MGAQEYIDQSEERILKTTKFLPFFIPDEESIRCYLGTGQAWKELYRSDFISGTDTEFFSYSSKNLTVSFPKSLIGNSIKITYQHRGDLNPGSIDVAPMLVRSWALRQNLYIKDGLYVMKSYVNGETGSDGWDLHIRGGSVIYNGELYGVSDHTYHLSHFGGTNGTNNVTGFIFFINPALISTAENTRMISAMNLIKTTAISLGEEGGGKDSALNSMYRILNETYNLSPQNSDYLEVIRGFVVSKGLSSPDLYIHYPRRSRIIDFKV